MDALRRIPYPWLLAAALLYGAVYAPRLHFPAEPYFDEVYHVKTAREILARSGYTDTAHPPLVKFLIAGSIRAFGDRPWAWRLVSLAFGFGALVALYGLVAAASGDRALALMTAFLFFFDGLAFTMARIAMLNAPMLFFMLAAAWAFAAHACGRLPRRAAFAMAGASLGLAMATRWVGVAGYAWIAVFLPAAWRKAPDKRAFALEAFLWLGVLPMAIYQASFLLLLGLPGYDSLSRLLFAQYWMGKYHWGLKEGHSYGSDWWGWPVLQRPIWLFFEKPGPVHGIFCVGNPALFWTLPVSFYYAGRRWIENGDRLVVLAVVGFLSQWLPWMFIGRVKFFHYIYPAVPFGCLATALLLKALWARGLWGKAAASAYLALVAGMFAYWYPLLSGFPVSEAYYQNHLWFPSWI